MKRGKIMNKNVMIAMEKIEQLDGQFNHYSINRYLQTKLRDIDFSVTTIKEWFQKEQLILAENSVLFSFSEYETFIEFLVEYAMKNYKKNLNDTESVFTDYQYIEFLLYLITHSELEKMEKAYCSYANIEDMSLNEFVITKIGMPLGDQLPLVCFLDIILNLQTKNYNQRYINLFNE